jgi:hypothetical protein
MHMGDVDFTTEDEGDIADASWEEVARTCCVHSPQEWGYIFLGLCLVLFFLYFFLLVVVQDWKKPSIKISFGLNFLSSFSP